MKPIISSNISDLIADVSPAETRVFYGITWDDYLNLSEQTLDKTNLHISYNRGILKIMGQGFKHENISRFLNSLIVVASLFLKINVVPSGSMSLISMKARKGAEPDESYYVQNAHLASFKKELFDDETDTLPDIVVEIDESHKSEDKFEIYAAFGIKEFWLYDTEIMRIFQLSETGEYLLSENSLALPILTSEALTDFLNRSQNEEQFKVLIDFQTWLLEEKS
jgi:Uma2 family endonuclease